MQDISGLETEVAEEVTIMGSATTLINGFADRLRDAGTDPAKLAKLQSDLDTQGNALAAAVAANTPAAEEELPPLPEVGGSTEGETGGTEDGGTR